MEKGVFEVCGEKGETGVRGVEGEDGSGGGGEGRGLTARLMGVAILHFRPVFVLVGPRQNRNTGGGHGGRL